MYVYLCISYWVNIGIYAYVLMDLLYMTPPSDVELLLLNWRWEILTGFFLCFKTLDIPWILYSMHLRCCFFCVAVMWSCRRCVSDGLLWAWMNYSTLTLFYVWNSNKMLQLRGLSMRFGSFMIGQVWAVHCHYSKRCGFGMSNRMYRCQLQC